MTEVEMHESNNKTSVGASVSVDVMFFTSPLRMLTIESS